MEDRLNDLHASHVVSTLKSLADLTDGAGNPRRAAERLAAKAISGGIRSITPPKPVSTKEAAEKEWSAIALMAKAELAHGPQVVDYEPATLRDLGFNDREITKMMMAKIVLYDHTPFVDWHVFEKVTVAFNDRDVHLDITQEPSIAEIAWAVAQMQMIDRHTPFGPEVSGYVAVAANREGLVVLPSVLDFASGVLTAQISGFGRSVADQFKQGVDNTETRVQKDRLSSIDHYTQSKHKKLSDELAELAR